jgi:F-type H+-transporting ATPase subunit b
MKIEMGTSTRVAKATMGRALPIALAGISLAAPAFAAGDAAHGPSTSDLIWQAVNLAILLVVIFVLARKPVQAYFEERRAEIKDDMDNAAKLLEESETQFKEWQGKVVDLEAEVDVIRRETRQRAEQEREQIVAAAHDSADRIKSDALMAIEQETRRAQLELRKEAAHLAVDHLRGHAGRVVFGKPLQNLLGSLQL